MQKPKTGPFTDRFLKSDSFLQLIYSFLIAIIIFLTPANFFLKLFESQAYVHGLRIDYLIPKLYLSDLFIILLLLVWWGQNLIKGFAKKTSSLKVKKIRPQTNQIFRADLRKILRWLSNRFLIITLLILLFIRQFFSTHPTASIAYFLRIFLLGLLLIFLFKNKSIKNLGLKINRTIIEKAMLITMFFQSAVALYQYFYQKTLFGYLLFGEPNINNYIGVAKSSIFGAEKILPYGTTAHPNVLGGFLAICLLYFFSKMELKSLKNLFIKTIKISKIFIPKNVILFLSLLALILSQSISAILTLILGITLIFYQQNNLKKSKKKPTNEMKLKKIAIIVFALFFVSIIAISFLTKKYADNPSINRRNYLNLAAVKMIGENVATGVGLDNFTSEVENYSSNREIVRFVQPVHNIILLFLAENGLLGLVIAGLIIFRYKKIINARNIWWVIALLPIAFLDHYLLSLNAGLLLLVFSFGYFSDQD